MDRSPNDFDFDELSGQPLNGFQASKPEFNQKSNSNDETEYINQRSLAKTKQKLQRIFLVLMAIGLVLGIFLSIGVVAILNKLGLTNKPDRIDRQEIQPDLKQSNFYSTTIRHS